MKELVLIETKKLRLPKDNEFLWKYIDIHRFLNLIKTKRFRFTRMDQFEDPLEGIPLETLMQYALIKNKVELNLADIILNGSSLISSENKLPSRLTQIHQIQKSAFVSCWFFETRESMAMWNLYSNSDGVAITVQFGKMKMHLKPVENKINIDDFYCGCVDYQDFQKIDPYTDSTKFKVKKIVLRKDCSYSHEKEIRFVVRSYKYDSTEKGLNSLTINLKELDLKVVCHPQMADWKKKNIKRILSDMKLPNAYKESEIKLRY